MRVSRKSWHYKLVEHLWDSGPVDNLCGYFWQVVASTLMISCTVFLGLIVLWVILLPFTWFLYPDAKMFIFGAGVAAIEIVLLLSLKNKLKEEFYDADVVLWGDRNAEPISIVGVDLTFFGVAWEWIKAKKDRYCPSLEFTNGNE